MHSGASYRSEPTLMTRPSGSYDERIRCVAHGVVLHEHSGLLAELLVQLQVVTRKAQSLLDSSHSLEIRCSFESVPAHQEQLDEVPGDVSSGNIQPSSEMWERKSVVYWDDMRYTISRIHHNTRLKTCGELCLS